MIDEKRVAGASYVLTFYKDVEALTNHNAQYLNLVLEMESKYKGFDINKLEDQEKQAMTIAVQNYRYYASKCYVEYESLKNFINSISKDCKIGEYYAEVKREFILSRDLCEKLVIEFNKIILVDVIKNLLESSEEYINSIYGTIEGQE